MTNDDWRKSITEVEHALVVSTKAYTGVAIGSAALSKTMDHTLLKLDAQPAQIDDLCAEARTYGFASVCVRALFVAQSVAQLRATDVKVACVVGFHEGTYDLDYKLKEAKAALHAGASELDIVLNYPQLQAGEYAQVYSELAALRTIAPETILLKLILETSQLDRSQIIAACVLAAAAGFDFVKTSTGFNGPGASEENVRLMIACCETLAGRDLLGHKAKLMQVKASGGVRSLADAVTMLRAGATRLGTSGSVAIAKEAARATAEHGSSREDQAAQSGSGAASSDSY